MQSGEAQLADTRLPTLRAELQLIGQGEVCEAGDGVILDPMRNQYFRIDSDTLNLLALWSQCRTHADLIVRAEEIMALAIDQGQVETLSNFLTFNELTVPMQELDWRRLVERQRSRKQGWLTYVIHNYLFMRFPLLAPDRALRVIAPRLWFFYTRAALWLLLVIGGLGLYLVSRQWDEFLQTFPHFLSVHGALHFGLALVIVKSLHELGHAVTAARYGCRVPAMGVCFMVLVPLLYTDVTDAWRLRDRKKRLAIDGGGLIVEFAVACIATFVWAFLPDGTAKSLAFALATTSWVLSLGLNLNPFMRFDGYYLLCDYVGIENLQPRSFAMGRWWLRELLFDLGASPPERFARRTQQWLIVYAWMVWIYRLILFTGIALLVYHMTFKLLGVALFIVEILVFIALPIWREFKEWHRMSSTLFSRLRTWMTLATVGLVGTLFFTPMGHHVSMPAVLEDAQVQHVFPPRAAVVVSSSVQRGQSVKAGDVIAVLSSPELEQERIMAAAQLKQVQWRLARLAGDDADRAEALVLRDQHATLTSRLAGLARERRELRLLVEQDGVVAELDANLHPGRWLQRTDAVALIRGQRQLRVRGYIADADVRRLDTRDVAWFVPDQALGHRRRVIIDGVAEAGAEDIDIVELSSHYGGEVAARPRQVPQGDLSRPAQRPATGQFLVTGHVDAPQSMTPYVVRGTLVARGHAQSFAARSFRQIMKVLVRESGL